MALKKNKNTTKSKIVSAAWRLFYEQGYDDTTIEEIVEASGTSKGSFYHYFEGKDALLESLSFLFDEKYNELVGSMDPDMNSFEKLLFLNRELFGMIENTVSLELLARMYSTQLVTRGNKHLLDTNRTYYRLIRKIAVEGQSRGQISAEYSVNEIVKAYALCERALLYDWCICNGDYSLKGYSAQMLPIFLGRFYSQK
ncbi:MAG: helix-turn-helix transcriptional regulator [Oscillospiraceae bacterium]|nr:helix-turn-helix transcriptional regulator [Oscillospiraceae bacterium]